MFQTYSEIQDAKMSDFNFKIPLKAFVFSLVFPREKIRLNSFLFDWVIKWKRNFVLSGSI